MTAEQIAETAYAHGHKHLSVLSNDICFSLAFSKIALWLHSQDEVSPRTAPKMREAMDILVRLWNQEGAQ